MTLNTYTKCKEKFPESYEKDCEIKKELLKDFLKKYLLPHRDKHDILVFIPILFQRA